VTSFRETYSMGGQRLDDNRPK